MSKYLKVRGIGRLPEHKMLCVYFNHRPTDEQLREFHDFLNQFSTLEERLSKAKPTAAETKVDPPPVRSWDPNVT